MEGKRENSHKAGKSIANIPYRGKAWLDCLTEFGGEGRQEYQTANGAIGLRGGIAIGQNGTLAKFLLGMMLLPLLGGQAAVSLAAAGLGENRLDASDLGAVSYPATFTAAWSPALLSEMSSKGEDTEKCIWVGDCE